MARVEFGKAGWRVAESHATGGWGRPAPGRRAPGAEDSIRLRALAVRRPLRVTARAPLHPVPLSPRHRNFPQGAKRPPRFDTVSDERRSARVAPCWARMVPLSLAGLFRQRGRLGPSGPAKAKLAECRHLGGSSSPFFFRPSMFGGLSLLLVIWALSPPVDPAGKPMAILDDIIEAATDDKVSIGTLLRKCLVLEQTFKNEKFRIWLNKELDGYALDEEMPPYRVFGAVSYGHFIGIAGRQISNQPLNLAVLSQKDYDQMSRCPLHQPASSYEGRPDKASDAQMAWNPALTAKYQTKFFHDSDMVLNRAWQLIPGSVLVGLLENVRNRVLRFALDLEEPAGAKCADG